MKNVEIEVFPIAKTQVDRKAVQRWLDYLGAHEYEIPDVDSTTDPDSKFHGKKQVTSMARRIIPMGVATGGVWTLNARALRHVIALRASSAAEEEICYVAGKIAKIMTEQERMLFGDFTQTPEGFYVPRYVKV